MGAFQSGAFQGDAFQGANPQTFLPSAATLVLTGATPAVQTPRRALPTAASLTVTGAVPAVLTPRVSRPTALSLVVSGATPAVLTPRVSRPTAASLTVVGSAPTVLTPRLVQPSAAALRTTALGDLRLTLTGVGHTTQQTAAVFARGVEPGYSATLTVDPANTYGFGANEIVLLLVRNDSANEASLTLRSIDTGQVGVDDGFGNISFGSATWTLSLDITGDPSAVVLVGRVLKDGVDVTGPAQTTDSYSIPRSDTTSESAFITSSSFTVERIGTAPTVTVTNARLATPSPALLVITGGIPSVAGSPSGGRGGHVRHLSPDADEAYLLVV